MKQAFIGGTERSHMKLMVDLKTDKVLAVHMAGTDAPEIVQSLGGGADRRCHQGPLRPHGSDAPDSGRGVRADARADPDPSKRCRLRV